MSDEIVGQEVQETAPRNWAEEAQGMGWNPEYDGPDKIDAREFVLRKPLFDEMKKLRKKTKELETAVRTQTQMQEQLLSKEREEAIRQLKQQKVQAIEESDAAKVIQIEDQLEQIKQQPVKQAGPPPEFIEWSSDPANSWYNEDEDMQAWADAAGLRMYNQNPSRPVADIYAEVSRKVRNVFPHKFNNPKRSTPSAVEGSTRGTTTKAEEAETRIPQDYKQVFHTLWRSQAWGDITKKEAAKKYVADLVKIGAIEAE